MKLSHFPKGGSSVDKCICDDLASLWKQSKDINWNNPYNARSHSIMSVEHFLNSTGFTQVFAGVLGRSFTCAHTQPFRILLHSLWFPSWKNPWGGVSQIPRLTLHWPWLPISYAAGQVSVLQSTLPHCFSRGGAQCLAQRMCLKNHACGRGRRYLWVS